jgi:polar amino acid transport system substrate-binding protein
VKVKDNLQKGGAYAKDFIVGNRDLCNPGTLDCIGTDGDQLRNRATREVESCSEWRKPGPVKEGPDGKMIGGVAIDVGRFIAAKIGVSFEPVAYIDSGTWTQSFGKGEWDIAIGPPSPLVAEKADFGPDLLLVDRVYTAAPGQEFTDAAHVDRTGVKIGTGRDSAQDLFLSRTLKFAELVRIPGGASDAIETLRSGKANLWASNATQAQVIIGGVPGAKIVPGAFNNDRSTVMLPKGRSNEAQGKLAEIISEAKRTGIVQRAIEQAGLKGVRVAPN